MSYRICIGRGDFRFEAEGDKKFVLQMLATYGNQPGQTLERADAHTGKVVPAKTAPAVAAAATGKKFSLGEFVRQLEFKKHIDLVLAFGYYLEKVTGLESFTSADINNCYYEAKLERSNSSQMIIQNIKKGFMMPAKAATERKRQAFVLTRSGEEFVTKHPIKTTS